MDVETYITDEVRSEVTEHITATWRDGGIEYLRAVLPGILAQHRQDVLREVWDRFETGPLDRVDFALDPIGAAQNLIDTMMADEAVSS